MTKSIVLSTFVCVAQHFVGLGSFLKFLLGFFIIRVLIRVKLNGNLAVRFFYFITRRTLSDSQYFVIISFADMTEFCEDSKELTPYNNLSVPDYFIIQ